MLLKTFLVCLCVKNIEIKEPVEVIISGETGSADHILISYAKNHGFEIKNFIVKHDLEAIAQVINSKNPVRYLSVRLISSSFDTK